MDVFVRATREEVQRVVRRLPAELLGRSKTVEAALERTGVALLNRVRRAFIAKSRGGTDETGERWKPLAASTKLKRAKPSPSVRAQYRPSYALTDAQREQLLTGYGAILSAESVFELGWLTALGNARRFSGMES